MKLKPCPFCGGKAETREDWGAGWYVECQECGTTRRLAEDSEEEATEEWNRRKPIDNAIKQLEDYKNMYSGTNHDKYDAYNLAIEIVKSGGRDVYKD